MYIPEMLFGHLLTGSNFDDDEKRLTGMFTNNYVFVLCCHEGSENKIKTETITMFSPYPQAVAMDTGRNSQTFFPSHSPLRRMILLGNSYTSKLGMTT